MLSLFLQALYTELVHSCSKHNQLLISYFHLIQILTFFLYQPDMD